MVTAGEGHKKRINLDTALTGRDFSSIQKVRLILSLSLPAILAQLTTIAMQYIDTAMVGSLGQRRQHPSAWSLPRHGWSEGAASVWLQVFTCRSLS